MKKGLEELQTKTASVAEWAQQTKELENESKILGIIKAMSEGKTKETLRTTEEILGITPYPSSESLQEFDSGEIDEQQYWYYAYKAEKIKKKLDQAIKAFHEKDEYYWDVTQYDEFYAEYSEHNERLQRQLERIGDILSAQKSTGLYEYPSTPNLFSHLEEGLDSKTRDYFENTKREVWHKNALAKRIYQHKLGKVENSKDEWKVNHEYQKFRKKQSWILSICDKRIQSMEDGDYVIIEGSMSSLHPESLEDFQKEKEQEVTREHNSTQFHHSILEK